MYYVAGPVKKANCISKTFARNIEIDDTAILSLEYERGTLGILGITMLSYPKNLEGSLLSLAKMAQ